MGITGNSIKQYIPLDKTELENWRQIQKRARSEIPRKPKLLKMA